MLISSPAHPWKGWVTLTMPVCTRMCSSPSRALGGGVACPSHAKTHISSAPSPLSSRPGIPIERCTGKSAISSLEQPPLGSVGPAPLFYWEVRGRKAMGCDPPSPQQSWAGLTLCLFRSIKVLGAPGPAQVIEQGNDCSLPPGPSRPWRPLSLAPVSQSIACR